jgi:translation initiation factor IF-1
VQKPSFAPKKPPTGNPRRRRRVVPRKDDKIYLDGVVFETLPSARFKVKVTRSKNLDPLIVDCQVKTIFKVRNIKIIKGDQVTLEIDPETGLDPESNTARGVIIERK